MSNPIHNDIPATTELPIYSRHDPIVKLVQHVYHLGKDNRQSLTVTFQSSASSAETIPRFHQSQTVSGVLDLSLQTDSLIRSITITITGDVVGHHRRGSFRFLTERNEIYNIESRDNISSSSDDHVPGSTKLKKGEHQWPFSVKLPKGVGIPYEGPDGNISKFILPASLIDKATNITIKYELVIRVKKGILSSGQRLCIPIEYAPLIKPDPPSLLRQVSYIENTPLSGPADDIEGWIALPTQSVQGTVFNTRPVTITYSAWLASPKCYTRGMPLHLWIEIICGDLQALDLVSSPSAQGVKLVRVSSYSDRPYPMGFSDTHADTKTKHTLDIASAELWPASRYDMMHPGRKALQGEIIVPADTSLDCEILDYTLEYFIVIHKPQTAGFITTAPEKEPQPLISEKIHIATLPAAGPPAIPRSPPRYTEDANCTSYR